MKNLINRLLEFKPQVTMTNCKGREQILPLSANNGIFCQHYVYCSKFENAGEMHKEMHDFATRKFVLPEGMSAEDAFKVLSFLTRFVEQAEGYEECSAVCIVDDLIERFKFRHIEPKGKSTFIFERTNFEPCTHLFTVNGNFKYFKRSAYAKDYFEWFSENVTIKEVKDIYAKLGMQMPDLFDNKEQEVQFVEKRLSDVLNSLNNLF